MYSKLVPVILILGLGAVSLWVFFGPQFHYLYSDNHPCAAAVLLGERCPQINSPLAIASHYLKGFRNFNQAVFSPAIVLLPIILLTTLLFLLIRRLRFYFNFQPRLFYRKSFLKKRSPIEIIDQILFWLVLHEKRDPAIIFVSSSC